MSGAQAAVLLSLGAAALYALTSVLQQSAAASVPHRRSMRPGLLLDLVRRPRWMLGNVAELCAYAMQFLALRRSSLLLVETVLVIGLLIALPLGASLDHRRLRRAEWRSAVVVVTGLMMFLAVAKPTGGRGEASGVGWAAVMAAGGVVIAVLIAGGDRRPGPRRATRLGAACGILFGLSAALTKACAQLLGQGVGPALASWEPYALVGLGGFGILLAQSALQAGPLGASLPVLTVSKPLVAATIGVLAFHERIAVTPGAIVIEVGTVLAMVVGVFGLTHAHSFSSRPCG